MCSSSLFASLIRLIFVNVAVSWNDRSARRPDSDMFLRWVIQDEIWVEDPGFWRGSEWDNVDVCPPRCSVSVGGDGGEGVIGRKSSAIRRRISGLSVTIDWVLNLSFWGVCGLLGSFIRSGVLVLERDDSPHTRIILFCVMSDVVFGPLFDFTLSRK